MLRTKPKYYAEQNKQVQYLGNNDKSYNNKEENDPLNGYERKIIYI